MLLLLNIYKINERMLVFGNRCFSGFDGDYSHYSIFLKLTSPQQPSMGVCQNGSNDIEMTSIQAGMNSQLLHRYTLKVLYTIQNPRYSPSSCAVPAKQSKRCPNAHDLIYLNLLFLLDTNP